MRVALLALALVAGCGSAGSPSGQPPNAATHRVVVFAAASLSSAFAAAGQAFQATHPGVKVTFSFAGSQTLVAQIQQGAPADVLATADTASMPAAVLSKAHIFARNRLAVITAPGDPKHITSLADLGRPGLRVVLAGPTVPVGAAARRALAQAGISVTPVSLEQDVKGVVTKVRLGEADAGIAYVTDVASAHGAVAGTALPGITNSYPVAVVRPGADAQAFVDFLLSPAGRAVLATYGFLPPA